MHSILTIIDIVLNLYMWCLIIAAILSWLAFGGVINTRNRFVYAVSDFLYRITEPALLAAKATRFPGQELRWDGANFRFTNHEQANQEILQRNYRDGFAPPAMA